MVGWLVGMGGFFGFLLIYYKNIFGIIFEKSINMKNKFGI